MKKPTALLFVLLLFAPIALAGKDRKWIPAKVTSISSTISDEGTAILPVGSGIYGAKITTTSIYYRIETDDMVYVLVFTGDNVHRWRRKHPLNVTLHGETKICIDSNGRDAHILDDAGKDIKIPIAEKIAKEQKHP